MCKWLKDEVCVNSDCQALQMTTSAAMEKGDK